MSFVFKIILNLQKIQNKQKFYNLPKLLKIFVFKINLFSQKKQFYNFTICQNYYFKKKSPEMSLFSKLY